MPAQWTADLIGQMHLLKIHKKRLAAELGVTPEYVSMVLNGRRDPPGAEEKFRRALARIIATMPDDTAS